MALRLLAGVTFVTVLLMGCDAKPPKPETGSNTAAAPGAAVDQGAARAGEKSLRLYGPGVSRERQIRV